jgi:hypothetical protein
MSAISRREKIVQALLARLALDPFFRSVRRGDRAALEADELPAAIISDRGDRAEELSPTHRLVSFDVAVDVVVAGEDAADALAQIAEARAHVLHACAEPTLGGLAIRVDYDGSSEPEFADIPGRPPEAAARLALSIEYVEDRLDPWA